MRTGFTLPEVLLVLSMVAILASFAWSGMIPLREASSLQSAARRVVAQLTLARRLAVDRRETVRFRAHEGMLEVRAADGTRLAALALEGTAALPVDSIRLAPGTLRFNARGQAAPGSVYLYRGARSVRIVCNFLGRLRVERVHSTAGATLPDVLLALVLAGSCVTLLAAPLLSSRRSAHLAAGAGRGGEAAQRMADRLRAGLVASDSGVDEIAIAGSSFRVEWRRKAAADTAAFELRLVSGDGAGDLVLHAARSPP